MVARDRGSPPQSAAGLVQIYVGEKHGQTTLRFRNSTYRIGIQENAQTGSDVVQVSRDPILLTWRGVTDLSLALASLSLAHRRDCGH